MRKKKSYKRLLLVLLGALVIMQFFRIDKSVPEVKPSDDFIAIAQPNAEIKSLLMTACYDCHSYKTEYPWYSNVAPVSWWIGHHIEEGREHLNFSLWGTFSQEKKDHKLHECAEETEEGEMPLNSYTWTHGDAKLSKEDQKKLAEWFESLMSEDHH